MVASLRGELRGGIASPICMADSSSESLVSKPDFLLLKHFEKCEFNCNEAFVWPHLSTPPSVGALYSPHTQGSRYAVAGRAYNWTRFPLGIVWSFEEKHASCLSASDIAKMGSARCFPMNS